MKKITAIILSLLVVLSLASCSSKETKEETTTAAETSTEASEESTRKEVDFSNMTVGKIKKISGNQITLELGEIDKDSIEKPEGASKFDPDNMPEGMSKPEGMSRPENMPEDASGFDPSNMPEGMTKPEGMTRPENMPEGAEDFDPSNMPEGFSFGGFPGGSFSSSITATVNYTGETARYTIPAEVKVGSGDYTSLEKDMVVALGFDEDGIVNSVMLITEKGTD